MTHWGVEGALTKHPPLRAIKMDLSARQQWSGEGRILFFKAAHE